MKAAAKRLCDLDEWKSARIVKCNPDPPQIPVRLRALYDGKLLFAPVPYLTKGFPYLRIDPERLAAKGVEFTMPIRDQGWGLLTQVKLPDGETLGLYEPRHPMAIQMKSTPRSLDKKVPAKKKKKRAGTRNAGGRKSGRS